MKNVFTGLTAVLLVIWYSLSVVGFDVHTCSGSGETYIATVASGFACEDIHPGPQGKSAHHGHSGCGCCHSERSEASDSGHGIDANPCCTDDFQVIILTGMRADDEQSYDGMHHLVYSSYVAEIQVLNHSEYNALSDRIVFPKPCIGWIVPDNMLAVYNVWRI